MYGLGSGTTTSNVPNVMIGTPPISNSSVIIVNNSTTTTSENSNNNHNNNNSSPVTSVIPLSSSTSSITSVTSVATNGKLSLIHRETSSIDSNINNITVSTIGNANINVSSATTLNPLNKPKYINYIIDLESCVGIPIPADYNYRNSI